MYLHLIGIDYRSAPIEIRDEIYRARKVISDFWMSADPDGSAIFVTCNRLEIYGSARYADDAFGLINRFTDSFPDFMKYSYIKYGESEVFRHLLRLASGLESQIKGEKQILAQLKTWKSDMTANAISDLSGKAILLSQKIRADSGIDKNNDNLAAIIFNDIKIRLGSRSGYKIIIAGTGKIAELFAEYRGADTFLNFAAHKNHEKAIELAIESGGEALYLEDLPQAINEADVLVCATSSPHYVIKKDHFDNLKIGRKDPLYVYDLAVPRGVAPDVKNMDGIYLRNLDELEPVICRHNESKKYRVELAGALIENALKVGGGVIYDKNY